MLLQFRPNQQTLAPLLNDARWPHVSPPAPPADKGAHSSVLTGSSNHCTNSWTGICRQESQDRHRSRCSGRRHCYTFARTSRARDSWVQLRRPCCWYVPLNVHSSLKHTKLTALNQPFTGSIAAYIQAGIGNVAVGSAFAGAQAAAMGAGVPFFGQAIGGALVGGGTYLARKFRGESS